MNAYIALDLETTGLSPKTDRILEIGAVRVENGQIAEQYSTLVNPRMTIPERITELTGIREDMVEHMPEAADAVRGLLDFCGDLPLLGHNLMFDYSFVKRTAVNQGLTFQKKGADTLKIARILLSELPGKGLQQLRVHYGICQEQAHRALGDAVTTFRLYERLKEEFGDENQELFLPAELHYKVKKQSPATARQKRHLQDLEKYHKIDLSVEVESLTKNEASRLIDTILASYGKIMR